MNFVGRNGRIFERFPGHFQQHALLRVHELGFVRRDAEEERIEQIDAADEAALGLARAILCIAEHVQRSIEIPAVLRRRHDDISPFAQQLPERLGIVGLAGKNGIPCR